MNNEASNQESTYDSRKIKLEDQKNAFNSIIPQMSDQNWITDYIKSADLIDILNTNIETTLGRF